MTHIYSYVSEWGIVMHIANYNCEFGVHQTLVFNSIINVCMYMHYTI